METVYDWVTVAIFAGLIVLFLQRSSGEDEPRDSIWQYLLASGGCALANWLGNNDELSYHHALAILALGGTLAYVWFVLKPLDRHA